jgi:hypothetical protein
MPVLRPTWRRHPLPGEYRFKLVGVIPFELKKEAADMSNRIGASAMRYIGFPDRACRLARRAQGGKLDKNVVAELA